MYTRSVSFRNAPWVALIVALAAVLLLPVDAAEAKPVRACALKKHAKCRKGTLSKLKVGKRNLAGANLAGATISGSTFTGTNLRDVDLSGARLTDVSFIATDLRGANFTGARLVNVRFERPKSAAPAPRARGLSCAATELDYYTQLTDCNGEGVDFSDTEFRKVAFQGGSLSGAIFRRATFTSVTFTDTVLIAAVFLAARFDDSRFDGTVLTDAIFDQSTGARFSFSTTNPLLAYLHGASFLGARDFSFNPPLTTSRPRGVDGAAVVTVSPGADAPTYTDLAFTAWWGGSYPQRRGCAAAKGSTLSGTCFMTAAVGDVLNVTITGPEPLRLESPGWSCDAAEVDGEWKAGCFGRLTGATTFTYSLQPTVAVAVLRNGDRTPDRLSKIMIDRVERTGALTRLWTCVDAQSCGGRVLLGTKVRVTVLRQFTNAYFGMNCPGETGDPIELGNQRTEWLVGADQQAGGQGDETAYNLRRVCEFTVETTTGLTALVDYGSG